MTFRCFAIRSIVFIQVLLLYYTGLAQNNTQQLPEIGYDWNKLYPNDPSAKSEAANWLQNYSIGLGEFTVKNLIDVCGKGFYKTPDNILIEKLSVNLPQFACYSYDFPSEAINYIKRTSPDTTQGIDEQIWRENYYIIPYRTTLYNKALNKRFKSEVQLIKTLRGHYAPHLGRWDSENYQSIKNNLLKVKNDSNKAQLLLTYLSQLIYLRADFSYLREVSDTLAGICLSSNRLTRLQKATFVTAAAKMIASTESYLFAEYIHSTFKLAEGFFLPNHINSEYYERLQFIRASYWNSLPLTYGKSTAIRIIFNSINAQNRKNWSNSTYYKYLTFLAYFNVCYMKEYYLDYRVYPRMQLLVLNYLLTASGFSKTPEVENNNFLDYYKLLYFKALSEYYSITMDFEKSTMYQYCAFDLCASSSDWLLHNNSFIEYQEAFEKHIAFDSSLLFSTIENRLKQQLPYVDSVELKAFYDSLKMYQLPYYSTIKDARQWGNDDIKRIKKYFLNTDIQYFNRFVNGYGYNLQEKGRRGFRLRLIELAKHLSASDPHSAYFFLARADSLKNDYNLDFFTDAMGNGVIFQQTPLRRELEATLSLLQAQIQSAKKQLHQLAEDTLALNGKIIKKIKEYGGLNTLYTETNRLKNIAEQARDTANKQKEIAEHEKSLAQRYLKITLIAAAIIIALLFIVINDWLRRMVISKTNNQIGHVSNKMPLILKLRLDNAVKNNNHTSLSAEKSKLVKLGSFLGDFYDVSGKRKNLLSNEIRLFAKLAEIEFNDKNAPNFIKKKVRIVSDNIDNIKVPTFTVFNILYNSFKKGGIRKEDKYVTICITEKLFRYHINIIDNGYGVANPIKSSFGTGLQYVKWMVRFNNLIVFFFPVFSGNRRDNQQGFEVSFSLLKLRK